MAQVLLVTLEIRCQVLLTYSCRCDQKEYFKIISVFISSVPPGKLLLSKSPFMSSTDAEDMFVFTILAMCLMSLGEEYWVDEEKEHKNTKRANTRTPVGL